MSVLRSTRRIVGRLLVGLAASSITAAHVFAQSGELYEPGQYFIGGFEPACTEFETLVTNEASELIHPGGFATIVINGPVFDVLPVEVRLFAYYQTCNMMIFDVREDVTQLADMFTARIGVAEGWLTAAVAESICETDMMVEAGWTMAPGPERCAAIYETMREALQQQ